jgi:hypothetical protein
MKIFAYSVLFFFLAIPSFIAAEVQHSFRKGLRKASQEEDGFALKGALSLPVSFSYKESKIGVTDGNYFNVEGRFKTDLDYKKEAHDWTTSLNIAQGFSMTPNLKNKFIKEKDNIELISRYLYNYVTWSGFYADIRGQTSIFPGTEISSTDKKYILHDVNNNEYSKQTTSEFVLTNPFLPFFLEENLGIIFTPVFYEEFILESRVAASFRQSFSDRQKVFVAEVDDNRIVRDLGNFYQIGPSAGLSIDGELFTKQVSYSAGVDAMWPAFSKPAHNDRSFLDSLVIDGGASVNFTISKWLSLSYEYSVHRIPDILEKFQQEHGIRVNIDFDWIYRFGQPQLS